MDNEFIRLEKGMSRINVKLKRREESEINGMGPNISKNDIEKLYEKLEALKAGDFVVLAGSIPNTLPDDIYETIMKDFVYSYPMKVYFGEGAARKAIAAELGRFGKTVMLAYGGGSIKKSGVYDEMRSLLTEAGKEIVDFSGIMPNPTYAKVQEGAAL